MRTIVILLLTMSSIIGQAQVFSNDMAAINNSYSKLKSNFTITSTTKSEDGKSSTQTIQVRMNGLSSYYAADESTELLVTQDVKVMLNREFEVLMVDSARAKVQAESIPTSLFDTLMAVYETIEYKNLSNNTGQYTLVPKYGQYERVVMTYDKRSFKIQKIVITAFDVNTQQNYSLTTQYAYSAFTKIPVSTNYVQKNSNGILTASKQWQSYEFLNYYNLQTR